MKKFRTSFPDLLSKKVYDKVWEEADDVIVSNRPLGIIYENVPDDLKDIDIQVMEIHIYPEQYRKRLQAYVDDKPFDNSDESVTDKK